MSNIDLKITNAQKHFSKAAELHNSSPKEKAKLAKAAREFESLFTSMMLKEMTKSTNGLFGEDSFGGDFFNTMFEQKMASYISEKQSLGIADMLYSKFTGEKLDSLPKVSELKTNNLKTKKNNTEIPAAPVMKPSTKSIKRLKKFEGIINKAADSFNIDKNLIKSVIFTESAGKVKALSNAKAKGLMQLMDSTAKEMGVNNIWNPEENIRGGAKYLARMLRQYNGDIRLSLAAYNAGPSNVNKYKGVPPFEETKNYVERVLSYYNYLNG